MFLMSNAYISEEMLPTPTSNTVSSGSHALRLWIVMVNYMYSYSKRFLWRGVWFWVHPGWVEPNLDFWDGTNPFHVWFRRFG
jgi:hypothetical protein